MSALWLVRAGKYGEHEQRFLNEGRIYATWSNLRLDVGQLANRRALFDAMTKVYPDAKPKRLHAWVSQVWRFARDMKQGDLVALPLKSQSAIAIGEITGPYVFEPDATDRYHHARSVKWLQTAVPREHFGQDLLYSLGSVLTICRIERNEAAARVAAMRASGWKPESVSARLASSADDPEADEVEDVADLEQLGLDRIAKLIDARFKGHELTRLVDGILRAQGYTTQVSPEGADGGADILAGSGALGFGELRLCVEVKSQNTPVDRPTVDKLLGAVEKFRAHQGLFVTWGTFKQNVRKELAASFFKVRLWDRKELLEQLFASYDKLDEELRAELPLKRVWTVALPEEE